MIPPSHPSGIHPRIVAKVVARRGRLHAYTEIVPERTAFVVIDMTRLSAELDPGCVSLVPAINRLAGTLRTAGGTVAWVTPAPSGGADANLVAIVGAERAQLFEEGRQPSAGAALWPGLDVAAGDLFAAKRGASAFFPGRCDLPDALVARGVDTVLIGGTVTNVCFESSARDAVELGHRVVMVSDALAGHSFGLHEATLATFYRIFGDVRPAAELEAMVTAAAAATH